MRRGRNSIMAWNLEVDHFRKDFCDFRPLLKDGRNVEKRKTEQWRTGGYAVKRNLPLRRTMRCSSGREGPRCVGVS